MGTNPCPAAAHAPGRKKQDFVQDSDGGNEAETGEKREPRERDEGSEEEAEEERGSSQSPHGGANEKEREEEEEG